jgi:hypothetical protein
MEDATNGGNRNGDHVTGNVRHEAGSSSGGKDSNDPVGDFDVEEPSYQDMLHGNVRRMSNTVSYLIKDHTYVGSHENAFTDVSLLLLTCQQQQP